MSWFKSTDIEALPVVTGKHLAEAIPVSGIVNFASGEDPEVISRTIGDIPENGSAYFVTRGAWSNIRLVEYLLVQAAPAEVYFTTWSISADAIRRLLSWKEAGLISRMVAVLDEGIRNRKPEIFQEAVAAFPELKFSKCHAKVAVIRGAQRSFTLMGSANFTRNPRIETGAIFSAPEIAEANIKWILEEVNNV